MKRLTIVTTMIACLFTTPLYANDTGHSAAISRAYIKGFLAGAQLSDREIISRLDADKNKQPSGFFKRAYKTRVGERKPSIPATFFAGFCLPDDTISEKVVDNILAELSLNHSMSDTEKANAVFKAIQKKLPC